jgi:transcriptional regulator with XRE-family HTH domain
MTQADLARETGMSPNNISRLESPEYGKMTVKSLIRIAEAFDVALVVRFEPFSKYINWYSGTPFVEDGLGPDALAVASFEDEERSHVFDAKTPSDFFPIYTSIQATSNVAVPGAVNSSTRSNILVMPARENSLNLDDRQRVG